MRSAPIVFSFALAACGPPPATIVAPPPPVARAAAADGRASDVETADANAIAELSKHAEAVLSAFGNRSPRLAADGRTLLFVSNRDGVPQLYSSDALSPRSEARRLAPREDRVVDFTIVPRRSSDEPEQLVFRSDHGADEKHALFSVPLDGQNVRALTSDPSLDHGEVFAPPGRPGTLLYSARDPKTTVTPVHELSLHAGTAAAKVAYTDPGVSDIVDVSKDGTHALMIRMGTLSDQILLDVDLVRGEAKAIYPGPAQTAAVRAAHYTDKGNQVLVATDGGAEENLLLALDRRTGTELWRYRDDLDKGAIRELSVSPDEKVAAILVDAGSRSALRFVDLVGRKGRAIVKKGEPTVRTKLRDGILAPGDGRLGPFTSDGSRVLVRWAFPEEPGSLFSVAVATGQPLSLRVENRPSLAALPSLTAVNLEVPAHDGLRIPVNLYVPKGGAEKKPVLVMVHGGPAASSSIGYSPLIRFYTAFGFCVVEPNVRGSTGFGRAYERADDGPKRLDALRDLRSVAEWVKTQPWADESRLVLWGGSYGGYMVLMGMTRQTELWRAGVDLVGPSSWRSFFASTTGPIREILSKEFGSPETDGAFLDSISPLADADKITRPLFVFQGQNDPRVPRPESDQIVTSLRRRGVAVEYLVASDEGHSLDKRKNQVAFLARTTLFLRKQLQIP